MSTKTTGSPFRGVNRLCRHCTKACKQFENVTVIYCPNYTHSGVKLQKPRSQQAQANALEAI